MNNNIDPQKKAENILRSLGYVAILWHIEDVRECADMDDLGSLTDTECLEVLDSVNRKHDASMGVCWETISFKIEELKAARKA